MPGFKKDKKHAKEPGGIAAAVTRQAAAKFSDGNVGASKGRPMSHAFSPSPVVRTPEIEPEPADDDQHAASPLLDALSAASASASTAPSMTADWHRGGIASSPGNLINLTSESPPTLPSSYEDSARPHHHWSAHRPFMGPSPAPSPPNRAGRRPLSFQMEGPSHLLFSHSPRDSSSTALRRSSLQSTCPTDGLAGFYPPLPHQPQPHFYGAPDLDLTITSQSGGIKAGDRGLFFGFDKLPCTDGSFASTNVVLAGYQGGLQVYAYNKRGVHLVASLRGLRGAVHHAKILPWTVNGHEPTLFPLVAVVLHGPAMPPRLTEDAERGAGGVSDLTSNEAASLRGRLGHQQDPLQAHAHSPFAAFQTSIEVYSLKSNKLVDVLLEAHKIPINAQVSLSSPLFQPPPLSGAFTIKADAGTVAICSGVTGECWVYRQLPQPQNYHIFACCGKLWTTLQQNNRGEMVDESDKAHHASTVPRRPAWQVPVFALNGRWFAYCPATPSSQISLRANLPVPVMGRGPGVASMTPPHLPTVSSSVDLPISDSVVNKFMRETTQELIQGAKWVGQQGLHVWNAYWNKPSVPQPQQQQAMSPRRPWTSSPTGSNEAAQFPPTHGAAGPTTVKEPGLVSIVDLATLANSAAVHPLTTFTTPLGCSFLSFSPSSLALFTASTKGDVQTVWDLLRIQHTHSSPLQTTLATNNSNGPLVRQIAQFSRMTVARIVDVVWTEPQGERLAMVTERGTIHLLDMPLSTFMWPPPRRRKVVPKSAPEASDAPSSAVSIASGAFGAAYQVARPFVTRSRRSSSNASAASGNILRGSAAQGGRAIAATISHSIGKTGTAINQLRHTRENRASLPSSTVLPSASCVSWLKSRKSQALVSVGGGLIRIFPCQAIHSTLAAGDKRLARLNRARDIKVPLLPDDIVAPIVRQILDLGAPEENLELSDNDMDTGNTITLRARGRTAHAAHALDATIPQAEIESSAPYQPFHTDRRVILCKYVGSQSATQSAPIADDTGPGDQHSQRRKKRSQTDDSSEPRYLANTSSWAFGKDIPAMRLSMKLPPAPDHENETQPGDHIALPQSAMERVMQFGDEEQIVVTTKRRRGARQGGVDEDGFFEDDCEVLDFADQRV